MEWEGGGRRRRWVFLGYGKFITGKNILDSS
jgi:hypothetical protein